MKRKSRKAALIFTALLIITTLYYAFDRAVFRALCPIAVTKATTEATKLIEASVFGGMPDGTSFTDVVREDDSIKSIGADVYALQKLRQRLTEKLAEDTDEMFITITVPLGSVIGGSIFSGRGVLLKVRVSAAGGLRVDTESEFDSAGLNQTCHRVYVSVSLDCTLLYHGKTESVNVSTKILVSENVIVGEVPDAYFRSYS